MSLLEKLTSGNSQLAGLNGVSPTIPNFDQSTLHREYSTIGDPNSEKVRPRNGVLPQQSQLDPPNSPEPYILNLPR